MVKCSGSLRFLSLFMLIWIPARSAKSVNERSGVSRYRRTTTQNGKMKEIGVSPTRRYQKNTRDYCLQAQRIFRLVEFPRSFGAVRSLRRIEITNSQRRPLENPPYGCANAALNAQYIHDRRCESASISARRSFYHLLHLVNDK